MKKPFLFAATALAMVGLTGTGFAQPCNDDFDSATVVIDPAAGGSALLRDEHAGRPQPRSRTAAVLLFLFNQMYYEPASARVARVSTSTSHADA